MSRRWRRRLSRPSAAGITPHYFPSLVECTITAGAFAAFALLFIGFSRIFPILSIWETQEDAEEAEQLERFEDSKRVVAPFHLAPVKLVVLVLAFGIATLAPQSRAGAQAPNAAAQMTMPMPPTAGAPAQSAASVPVPKPGALVALTSSREDGKVMLVATVTANEPQAAPPAFFFVPRFLGGGALGAARAERWHGGHRVPRRPAG